MNTKFGSLILWGVRASLLLCLGCSEAASGDPGSASGGSVASGGAGDCEPAAMSEGMVYDGSLVIATPEELEQAKQYSVINRGLSVRVPEAELPLLTKVGGDLSSSTTAHLRLPNLREVGGSLYYYLDANIVTLDLRSLRKVGGEVYLHRNLALRELQLDSLVTIGTSCHISANLALADCYLDVIAGHCDVLHTQAPECTCTRTCGAADAQCQ